MKKLLSILFFVLTSLALGAQTNYYVETTGNDSNDGLSELNAKATLQSVINQYDLDAGDTIFVGAGTFNEDVIEFETDDNGFVIKGEGQGVTILDGIDDAGTGFEINWGTNDDITWEDFTIQNMENAFFYNATGGVTGNVIKNVTVTSCSDNVGAGIRIFSNPNYNISVENSTFHNNTTTQYGGCVYVYGSTSTLTFTDCNFYNNTSDYSGTVLYASNIVSGNDIVFNRCKMYENTANGIGGTVINMDDESSLTLTNCLIYENNQTNSFQDGLIYINSVTTVSITNCTVVDNTNSSGETAGLFMNNGTANVKNSIFWNNDLDDFDGSGTINTTNCIYQTNATGGSNTSGSTSDPLFSDSANDDYSIGSGSPAVDNGTDTGAPSIDINGDTRTGTTDIGAYEFVCPSAIWDGDQADNEWTTAANWDINSVPCGNVTIADVTHQPITSTAISVGGTLTIDAGANITVSSNTITVSGATDNNGIINIGTGIIDFNNTFDGTGGTIDFTDAGRIKFASTVSSLGTLDDAQGTIEFDGADAQTIPADTYYNVEFDGDGTGTKTLGGNITANGTLYVTSSCEKLDISTYTLSVTGTSDLDSDMDMGASSTITFDGNVDIDAGATFTAGSNAVLNINGNWINNGTYINSTETVTFGGSSQQSVTTSASTSYTSTVSMDAINEGFESGLGGFATSGSVSFTSNSSYYNGGSKSVSNDYTTSNTSYLTYNTDIDLSSYTDANLTFYHIAKTEGGYDKCYVEYSEDGGSNWTAFSNTKYSGSAVDYSSKGYFHEDSYATWGTSSQTPDNSTWWKQETFDMNFLVGQSDIRIRFKVTSDGLIERDGWYIDDVIINGTASTGGGEFQLSNEFYNVTLNGSGGVDMTDNVFGVANTLTMTQGVITCGVGDTVFVENTSGSSLTGYTDASFVNGVIRRNIDSNTDTYAFPVGNGTSSTNYYLAEIVNNNLTDVKYLTGKFDSGAPSGYGDGTDFSSQGFTANGGTEFTIDTLSTEGYWTINADNVPSGGDYAIKLYTANFNKDYWTDNEIAIIKRNTGSSNNSDWSVSGTIPNDDVTGRLKDDSYQLMNSITSFSEFAISYKKGAGILPVELLSLEANCKDGYVEVSWVTASEINNDYFSLEKLDNSKTFNYIGEVMGNGTTTDMNEYYFNDFNYENDNQYYRLTQYDFDGKKEVFDLVSVNCKDNNISKPSLKVLNQNSSNQINIQIEGLKLNSIYTISVYDISGKRMFMYEGFVENIDLERFLDISNFPKSTYVIQVFNEENVLSQKFLK
jgi:hypothetical protein